LQNYDGDERQAQMAFEWCTAVDGETANDTDRLSRSCSQL